MPNDLNANTTKKTIDYVKTIDNIGPRFMSFLNSEYATAWRESSIKFLNQLPMAPSDFDSSLAEYSKVTETRDKELQTKLKTDVDGLLGEINRNYVKYTADLNAFKARKADGNEGNFKVSPLPILRKYANVISSKCDLKISEFKSKDTSGGDINFIYAHNIILILKKFTDYMNDMLGKIRLESPSGRSEARTSLASIFKADKISKVICGKYNPDQKDSELKIVFTKRSAVKVEKYLSTNNITSGPSNSINKTVKKDFIDFVTETNSEARSSDFKAHLDSISSSNYVVEYIDDSPPKVIFKFNAPSAPGIYYKANGNISGDKYEVTAQSPANDFIFSKKNVVDSIIKNAIGEAPLYKCKHKGKWYYYTPTQLVLNGGKLVDSSGNKFRPKNGRPASLSGMKK